jgi:hypothetical protein
VLEKLVDKHGVFMLTLHGPGPVLQQLYMRLARAAMTVAGNACAKKDAKSDMI